MRNGCVDFLLVIRIAIVLTAVSDVVAQDDYEEEEEYTYGGDDYDDEVYEGDDYGGGVPEIDHCNQYDDAADGQCSHARFPEQDAIPAGAMRCCDNHRYRLAIYHIFLSDIGRRYQRISDRSLKSIYRYLFDDHCEVRLDTHGGKACGGPSDNEPTLPSYSVRCPDHCKMELLHEFNISSDSIGDRRQQTMTVAEGGTVQDYCLSYACHPDKRAWEMAAWACVCFGESAIAAVDKMIDSNLTRSET